MHLSRCESPKRNSYDRDNFGRKLPRGSRVTLFIERFHQRESRQPRREARGAVEDRSVAFDLISKSGAINRANLTFACIVRAAPGGSAPGRGAFYADLRARVWLDNLRYRGRKYDGAARVGEAVMRSERHESLRGSREPLPADPVSLLRREYVPELLENFRFCRSGTTSNAPTSPRRG